MLHTAAKALSEIQLSQDCPYGHSDPLSEDVGFLDNIGKDMDLLLGEVHE